MDLLDLARYFLFPLATLVAGFLLSGLGQWFRDRSARKRVRRRALSYALEERASVAALAYAFVRGNELAGSEAQARAVHARTQALHLDAAPSAEAAAAGLVDALDDLAEFDPLLATDLRSKTQGLASLRRYRDVMQREAGEEEQDLAALLFKFMSERVLGGLLPALDETILQLAEALGRRTHRRVREYFERDEDRVMESDDHLDDFRLYLGDAWPAAPGRGDSES